MTPIEVDEIQQLFKHGIMPDQQRWITEELHRPLESVTGFDADLEVIEVPSETEWKSYLPGKKTYRFTFADGTQHTYGGGAS